MVQIEIEIEYLKALMVEAANEFGYTAQETVSVSQALDEKLNEYQEIKEEKKCV